MNLSTFSQASTAVIIPAFNRELLVCAAIENVLSQNCQNLEIIVVDDGSDDRTAERARSYPGVRVLSQANGGPAAARNFGISNTQSDFIAFLDSDDLWAPHMLARLLNVLEGDPQIDVAMGLPQLARIKADGQGHDLFGEPGDAFSRSISGTVFRRTAFLNKVGLFDRELRFGEDLDWFLRAQECKVIVQRLDAISVFFRRHDGNMTKGKNMVDLNLLRNFKKSLDRKRTASTP
ncbi:glycosyltransferase family 2 protein [Ottowia thiooxydans]|uniref:Glycosyltransferase involved in cell wall biosynthesis n=1 Tax=Ottowia thiooxydans TaxID=219182 RepID=A0ABV2QDN6_9BURK